MFELHKIRQSVRVFSPENRLVTTLKHRSDTDYDHGHLGPASIPPGTFPNLGQREMAGWQSSYPAPLQTDSPYGSFDNSGLDWSSTYPPAPGPSNLSHEVYDTYPSMVNYNYTPLPYSTTEPNTPYAQIPPHQYPSYFDQMPAELPPMSAMPALTTPFGIASGSATPYSSTPAPFLPPPRSDGINNNNLYETPEPVPVQQTSTSPIPPNSVNTSAPRSTKFGSSTPPPNTFYPSDVSVMYPDIMIKASNDVDALSTRLGEFILGNETVASSTSEQGSSSKRRKSKARGRDTTSLSHPRSESDGLTDSARSALWVSSRNDN